MAWFIYNENDLADLTATILGIDNKTK